MGTVLKVIAEDGGWLQVQVRDPQWGLRTGWVKMELVTVDRPELRPMDLSIETSVPPAQDPRVLPPQRPAASAPPFRAHVVGRTGVTFGTETAALAGLEFSGDVLPLLQVYGAFDWHQNSAPDFLQDVGDIVGDIYGVDIEMKIPTFIGVGGLKVIAPTRGVPPYGLGGFGVGHLRGKVSLEGSDITDLLDDAGYLDKDDIEATRPLFEVGGGVVVPAGRLYIDAGYRFRKFLNLGEAINMSGFYFGAGVSY